MGMQVVEEMDALESALTQAQALPRRRLGTALCTWSDGFHNPAISSIKFWRMSMVTPCTCMSANVRFNVATKS